MNEFHFHIIALLKYFRFMEERNTPIERPPMLGFKQSKLPFQIAFSLSQGRQFIIVYALKFYSIAVDLHMFFQKVLEQGGYDGCVSKKAWKSVYDELGGNPQNTSAATCTRRHYEKYVQACGHHSVCIVHNFNNHTVSLLG